MHTPESGALLQETITSLLSALAPEDGAPPKCLYQLSYEQKTSSAAATKLAVDGQILEFPTPPLSLTFDDDALDPVQEAWRRVVGEAVAAENDVQYMVFADREGVGDEDDYE